MRYPRFVRMVILASLSLIAGAHAQDDKPYDTDPSFFDLLPPEVSYFKDAGTYLLELFDGLARTDPMLTLDARLDIVQARLFQLQTLLGDVSAQLAQLSEVEIRDANSARLVQLAQWRLGLNPLIRDVGRRPTDPAVRDELAARGADLANFFMDPSVFNLWQMNAFDKRGMMGPKNGVIIRFRVTPTLEHYFSALSVWLDTIQLATEGVQPRLSPASVRHSKLTLHFCGRE